MLQILTRQSITRMRKLLAAVIGKKLVMQSVVQDAKELFMDNSKQYEQEIVNYYKHLTFKQKLVFIFKLITTKKIS